MYILVFQSTLKDYWLFSDSSTDEEPNILMSMLAMVFTSTTILQGFFSFHRGKWHNNNSDKRAVTKKGSFMNEIGDQDIAKDTVAHNCYSDLAILDAAV